MFKKIEIIVVILADLLHCLYLEYKIPLPLFLQCVDALCNNPAQTWFQ